MSTAAVLARGPLGAQILASDELYFRLAACVRMLSVGELVYAPGLTHVSAGCVVQSVQFRGTARDAEAWVDEEECEMREVGARLRRIYLQRHSGPLCSVLTARGYRARREIAFCLSPHCFEPGSKVRFHHVTSEEHWAERRRMHEEDRENSDGYQVDPQAWCDLIRNKCRTGAKESFLVEYQGRICGSIGVMVMRDLLRFKNLLIRPSFRRQGLGGEVLRELAELTRRRGLQALGAFGIEGEAGAALYRSAGFSSLGWQTEWCKRLVALDEYHEGELACPT